MTMDELALVAQLRDDYRAGIDLTEPQRRLAAEISAASSMIPVDRAHTAHQNLRDHEVRARGRRRKRAASSGRRFRPKLVAVGAVAAVVAAATVIALQKVPAHPAARAGASPRTSADADGLRLASYAAKAAASEPAWLPNEWIYSDVLNSSPGPEKPGGTSDSIITWTQVDNHQFAYYGNGASTSGKLVIQNEVRFLGQKTAAFGRPVTEGDLYSYLQSLPTTPAALRAVIVHNLVKYNQQPPKMRLYRALGEPAPIGNYGVWYLIEGTLENTILPPRLLAAVYGILATDPVVHFVNSVTDNVGQTGVGFYALTGVWKYEIMINPKTYAYMGVNSVAVASWTPHWTVDGVTHTGISVKKGDDKGWTDLVASGIVQHPGQLP
jgi:hypothetical protein